MIVKNFKDFKKLNEDQGLANKPNNIKQEKEIVEYDIPEWALSPIINDDYDNLDSTDRKKLINFLNEVEEEHGNTNFHLGNEIGFKHSNDIDNKGSNVYRIYLFV